MFFSYIPTSGSKSLPFPIEKDGWLGEHSGISTVKVINSEDLVWELHWRTRAWQYDLNIVNAWKPVNFGFLEKKMHKTRRWHFNQLISYGLNRQHLWIDLLLWLTFQFCFNSWLCMWMLGYTDGNVLKMLWLNPWSWK